MSKRSLAVMTAAALLIAVPGLLAAVEPTVVNIVKNAQGKFVFDQPTVTITSGGEIKWVATGNAPHHLVRDSESDAFKDTGQFTSPATPVQQFDKAGTINYHCKIHASMKGTIVVK